MCTEKAERGLRGRILLERGAQANTQDMVSSSRPVQCLLLIYVLVVYMWTVSGIL